MINAVGRDIPEALLVNGKEVYQGKNYMDGKYLQKAAPRRAGSKSPRRARLSLPWWTHSSSAAPRTA